MKLLEVEGGTCPSAPQLATPLEWRVTIHSAANTASEYSWRPGR